jgi:5-methylcytosine-specific restriction endonuclease McrA
VKRKSLPYKIRRHIYEKYKGICVGCGKKTVFFGNTVSAFCGAKLPCAIDHIKPVYIGGTDDENNLQLLCISCNSIKGAKYDPD